MPGVFRYLPAAPSPSRSGKPAFRFFKLDAVSLDLAPGQIMGLVGPNGAGKSTTIRILMGLIPPDSGDVRVLGRSMPAEQALAKRDIGYVSDDMRLFANATLAWHMQFVASIYPGWDVSYATAMLKRFNLQPAQTIKGLSQGEHMKALLLLTTNEPVVTGVIILTNLSVSLFFLLLSNIPSIMQSSKSDIIVWDRTVFGILAAEVAVALVALAVPFVFRRHKRGLI